MDWYVGVLKKYLVFEGRARRKEYWMYFLISFLVSMVLTMVESGLGLTGVLSGLYGLAVLLPGLGVGVRRLHDIDRSGWWLLIAIVPLIGVIVLILFAIREGTPGNNQYGPNPKEA